MKKQLVPLTVLGMMSGSSLDGMDICVCKFTPLKDGSITFEILAADTIEYEAEWIDHINNALHFSVSDFYSFVADYSYYIGIMAKDFINIYDVDVDLISSHGHTLDHRPEDGISIQIGDPGVIAGLTQIDTVADFRVQDVTLGGQGAPIIPIAEKILWPEVQSFINLGGIANVSIHTQDKIIAWDIIPCNQVLNDQAMILGAEYDENGDWAKEGKFNEELAATWDKLDYFKHQFPKSLDNNWIREEIYHHFGLKIAPKDALHTACHHIALQIKKDIQTYAEQLPKQIMLTGGGAHNRYLVDCIKNQLLSLGIEIIIPEDIVINYKEAAMTALLGYLYLADIPSTIPSVTGADRPTIAGKYCKG